MTRNATPATSKFVVAVLVGFGVYSVLLGLFMLFAPGPFFETLGAFGVRNDHYIFDNASFELPLGLMLLAALRWDSWQVPALAFATAHWALHALSHIVDTNHAHGTAVGLLEFVGLALGTALLAFALRSAVRASGPLRTTGRAPKSSHGSGVNRGNEPKVP